MDVTLKATIQSPGGHDFMGNPLNVVTQDVSVVVHIDANTQSELASILGGAPATPLTPTGLAAQYSAAELSAALSLKLAT